eukprot:gene19726-23631_t
MKLDADFVMSHEAIDRLLGYNDDMDTFIEIYRRAEKTMRLYDLVNRQMLDRCVNGNAQILEYLLDKGYKQPTFAVVTNYIDRVCKDATITRTRQQCYEHIKWLVSRAKPLDVYRNDIMSTIAPYNDTDLFRFILDNRVGMDPRCQLSLFKVVQSACANSNYDIIEHMERSNVDFQHYINLSPLTDADFIRHMYAKYGNPNYNAEENWDVRNAIAHNRMDLLKFHLESLPRQFSPVDVGCFISEAAAAGSLDILEYFLAGRSSTDWDGFALYNAAGRGHLHVVEMLHGLGEPQNFSISPVQILDAAADSGNLDVVRFIHENTTYGCTEEALTLAVTGGHYEVVEFLLANRTENNSSEALEVATSIDIVKLLLANGAQVTQKVIDNAASAGRIDILTCLGWPSNAAYAVSKSSLFELYRTEHYIVADAIVRQQPGIIDADLHQFYVNVAGQAGKEQFETVNDLFVNDQVSADTLRTSRNMARLLYLGHYRAFKWIQKSCSFPVDMKEVLTQLTRLIGSGNKVNLQPLFAAVSIGTAPSTPTPSPPIPAPLVEAIDITPPPPPLFDFEVEPPTTTSTIIQSDQPAHTCYSPPDSQYWFHV